MKICLKEKKILYKITLIVSKNKRNFKGILINN